MRCVSAPTLNLEGNAEDSHADVMDGFFEGLYSQFRRPAGPVTASGDFALARA
jgi:hypothetical protein